MADENKSHSFTTNQLEEIILFCICANKKNILDIGSQIKCFINKWNEKGSLSPFAAIRNMVDKVNVPLELKNFGIENYSDYAVMFIMLAFSGFNLRTCPAEDLYQIKGISRFSVRNFIACTRNTILNNNNKFKLNYVKNEYEKLFEKQEQDCTDDNYKKVYKNQVIDIDLDLWNIFRKNKL